MLISFFLLWHTFVFGIAEELCGQGASYLQDLLHKQITKATTCKFTKTETFVNSDLLFSFFILLIWKKKK